ncbi:MAG TPA: ABC transporter permease [Acidobacteriota bacterium]|nr:ABC transporter permease [Acidobacteriota bacterium]
MKAETRRHASEWLVTLPSFVWLLLLFLVPTVLVFAITFKPPTPYGGIGEGWTLNTLRTLGNPNYPAIIWRTVWLSVEATAICILLATPMGYYMARVSPARRRLVLLLVILPFWTSFLVRIFAWKVLLHPEGLLKNTLVFLGLVGAETSLLYNAWSVLLVMVYTELPFAILPIYAAAEKFDFRLIEAAKDLGASSFCAFRSVFLPGIRVGLLTAFLMVFIPSLGSYVIPDIVGGPTSEMIGNKIAQRTFVDRNLPHAAGLSAFLTVAVLIPMIAITTLRGKESPRDTLREEGI